MKELLMMETLSTQVLANAGSLELWGGATFEVKLLKKMLG